MTQDPIYSNFIEILTLANKVAEGKPLPKTRAKHEKNATYVQRIRATAIAKNTLRLEQLHNHLAALRISHRRFATNDATAKTPQQFTKEINKTKRAIWQIKYYLSKYKAGLSSKQNFVYRDATIILKTNSLEQQWLRYWLEHEVDQWERFFAHDSASPTGYAERTLAMENKYGKQYPESRRLYFERLLFLNEHARDKTIAVSAKDGKWMILRISNIIKRYERERALNLYLKRAREWAPGEEDMNRHATRKHGETVYKYPSLEELEQNELYGKPRTIQHLWAWHGCQLLDTERDMLIKVALDLKKYLIDIFVCPIASGSAMKV